MKGEPTARTMDCFGLCQWFHFEDDAMLRATVADLRELGLRHLRTGISWADFHRPGGRDWVDHQMAVLASAGLEILLSVWHTPPSLAEGGRCSGPPRRLLDYADFIDCVIGRYEGKFADLELWNEPNNRIKWNFLEHDPDWSKFAEMLGAAAHWAKHRGQRTVLGGMIPVDPHWLQSLDRHGALDDIDVVAIHGFPGMWTGECHWWDWPRDWRGWADKLERIAAVAAGRPVWITETGYSTCLGNSPVRAGHAEQVARLREALRAPAERVYWYCARDLSSRRACIEMTEDGGRIDHREYHLGLTAENGWRKPAWHALRAAIAECGGEACFPAGRQRAAAREPSGMPGTTESLA